MTILKRKDRIGFACNKCGIIYKAVWGMTAETEAKHRKKKHFCPTCILYRRDPEDGERIRKFRKSLYQRGIFRDPEDDFYLD